MQMKRILYQNVLFVDENKTVCTLESHNINLDNPLKLMAYDFLNILPRDANETCYRCHYVGHDSTNCTEPSVCYLCKFEGHKAKDCPDKPGSQICFRCRQKGHRKSECVNAKAKDGPYILVPTCWNCQGQGHRRCDCRLEICRRFCSTTMWQHW